MKVYRGVDQANQTLDEIPGYVRVKKKEVKLRKLRDNLRSHKR